MNRAGNIKTAINPLNRVSSTATPPSITNTNNAHNEDIGQLKRDKEHMEGELKIAMDNLLVVVDEVKFMEEEIDGKKKQINILKEANQKLNTEKSEAEKKFAEISQKLIASSEEREKTEQHLQALLQQQRDVHAVLENQLVQQKKRNNTLQNDCRKLVAVIHSKLPELDEVSILDHPIPPLDEPILAVLPDGLSFAVDAFVGAMSSPLPTELLFESNDISELRKELLDTHHRLELLQNQYSSLQLVVSHSQDVFKQLATENDTRSRKGDQSFKELEREKEELVQELEKLKEEYTRLEGASTKTDEAAKAMRLKIDTMQGRNGDFELILLQKEQELKGMTKAKDKEVVRQLEQLLKKAREQLLSLQANNDQLQRDLLDKAHNHDHLLTSQTQMFDKFAEEREKEQENFLKQLALITEEKNQERGRMAKDAEKIKQETEKVKRAALDSVASVKSENEQLKEDLTTALKEKVQLEQELAKLNGEYKGFVQQAHLAHQKSQPEKIVREDMDGELGVVKEELNKTMSHNETLLRSIAAIRRASIESLKTASMVDFEQLRGQLSEALAAVQQANKDCYEQKLLALRYQVQLEQLGKISGPEIFESSLRHTRSTAFVSSASLGKIASAPPPKGKIAESSSVPADDILTENAELKLHVTRLREQVKKLNTLVSENKAKELLIIDTKSDDVNKGFDLKAVSKSIRTKLESVEQAQGEGQPFEESGESPNKITLKKLLEEERWKLEEAVRENAEIALNLNEIEEILSKEIRILTQKLDRSLNDLAIARDEAARSRDDSLRSREELARANREKDDLQNKLAEKDMKLDDLERFTSVMQHEDKGEDPSLSSMTADLASIDMFYERQQHHTRSSQHNNHTPKTVILSSAPSPIVGKRKAPPVSSTSSPVAPAAKFSALADRFVHRNSVITPVDFSSELTESERQVKELEAVIDSLRQELDVISAKFSHENKELVEQQERLRIELDKASKMNTDHQFYTREYEKLKVAATAAAEHASKMDTEVIELRKKLELAHKEHARTRQKLFNVQQQQIDLAKENFSVILEHERKSEKMSMMMLERESNNKNDSREREFSFRDRHTLMREMEGEKEKEITKAAEEREREKSRERERIVRDEANRRVDLENNKIQEGSQHFKALFYNQVVERLEGDLLRLQRENDELRSTLQQQIQSLQEGDSLKAETETLKRNLSHLDHERLTLTNQTTLLRDQMQNLMSEREALADQFETLYRETVGRLEEELQDAKTVIRDFQAQTDDVRDAVMGLDERHMKPELYVKLESMVQSTRIRTLEQQVSDALSEADAARSRNKEVLKKIDALQSKAREDSIEKTELEREKEKLHEVIKNKTHSIERLQEEISRMRQELLSTKVTCAEVERARSLFENKNADLEKSNYEKEKDLRLARDSLADRSKDLQEAQTMIDGLLKDNIEMEHKLLEREQVAKDLYTKLDAAQADSHKMHRMLNESIAENEQLKLATSSLVARSVYEFDSNHSMNYSKLPQTSKSFVSGDSPQNVLAVALENRLAEAHRKLQLVEQENTVLHDLLLQSQTSLNEYAQDIEEQMLQQAPVSSRKKNPMEKFQKDASNLSNDHPITPPTITTPTPNIITSQYGKSSPFWKKHKIV